VLAGTDEASLVGEDDRLGAVAQPALRQDVVHAGLAAIEATFPHGSTRGPGFVLERSVGEGWQWRYALGSDPEDAPDGIKVFTADEFVSRDLVWNDGPLFDGTDAHLIPVPEDAEPGRWRVCTAPDAPAMCAVFEVATDEP
jgi:hypothetical protein